MHLFDGQYKRIEAQNYTPQLQNIFPGANILGTIL